MAHEHLNLKLTDIHQPIWMAFAVALMVAPVVWGQEDAAVEPKARETKDATQSVTVKPEAAKAKSPKDSTAKKESPQVDPLTLQLRSDDATEQQKGIDGIKALFARDPSKATDKFKKEWVGLLLTSQHYQDVLDLSTVVVMNVAGELQSLEQMQKVRIQALIGLGKPEEALSNAKSYYNVASMKGTAEAIMAVVQCLNINPSADSNRLDRFKAQQLLSSNSVAALKEMASGPSVLGGMHVTTPDIYTVALKKYGGEDFGNLTARGNLLLLADRVKEAREVFERAYVIADDKQVNAASESIARLMKAEDGSVFRANAWVLSIRPPAPPEKPAKKAGEHLAKPEAH